MQCCTVHVSQERNTVTGRLRKVTHAWHRYHIVHYLPSPPNPTLIQSATSNIYNFALVCAFLRIGSIFVAFMTSPLTLSFPLMNSFCAFALPATRFPKSPSLSDSVTVAFLGGAPLPTVPLSFRSMYHDSVAPAPFFSVKANTAPPFAIASFRPASSAFRDCAIASKAADEGKASAVRGEGMLARRT